MRKLHRNLILIVFSLYSPLISAETIESVFQDASRYTVKIETTVEHPYFNGSPGKVIGAGFLVDKSKGWVLTNRHVVSDALSSVDVRFMDSDYVTAEKLYLDPHVDLALVRIPTESIPDYAIEADLGCNENPQMGNAAVIFGHPSGLNFTGTRGIISGTTFLGSEYLQTDAPLNSGNSGGPLISISTGKVVGVSVATYDAKVSEGLNLTISIDQACKIVSLINLDKDPSPPTMPIIFFEHDLDDPELAVAKSYYSDKSLLQTGDVIVRVDGSEELITNIDHLNFQLRGLKDSVNLVVNRNVTERIITLPIVLQQKLLERKGLAVSGMTMLDFNPVDKGEGGTNDTVYVAHVAKGSYAESASYSSWDSVYSIYGARVFSTDDIYQALLPLNGTETEAKVVVRVGSHDINKTYDYHIQPLKIRDLQVLKH